MRLWRVDADAQDLAATRGELGQELLEPCHLRGANEGEVGRIEEQDEPAASVVGEAVALGLATADAGQVEGSGGRPAGEHGGSMELRARLELKTPRNV